MFWEIEGWIKIYSNVVIAKTFVVPKQYINICPHLFQMARLWEDKSPLSKCPYPGEFPKPTGYPYFPNTLSPFDGEKHHRCASESELAPPAGQDGSHPLRMKSLSESEALTLSQGHHSQGHHSQGHQGHEREEKKGHSVQDHPVLKTALNAPPLCVRDSKKDEEREVKCERSPEDRKGLETGHRDERKSSDSQRSDETSIDILETHSEGSKCSSPASTASEPYMLHKKLKMKRRCSADGTERSSPDGSTEGYRKQEVEGLESKMAQLNHWEQSSPRYSPTESPRLRSPRDVSPRDRSPKGSNLGSARSSPCNSQDSPGNRDEGMEGELREQREQRHYRDRDHSPPQLAPAEKSPERDGVKMAPMNGLAVTTFGLTAGANTHPAYLPPGQFPSLHHAYLYQYNTFAMQSQLAHLQQLQLAQLHMSQQQQKHKRPDASPEYSTKDNNQNRWVSRFNSVCCLSDTPFLII